MELPVESEENAELPVPEAVQPKTESPKSKKQKKEKKGKKGRKRQKDENGESEEEPICQMCNVF
jgi:hypothetical protein